MKPERICISPGPCTPNEAGISCGVIEALGATTPILGVCLGPPVDRPGLWRRGGAGGSPDARQDLADPHEGTGVFAGLPDPFEATRYHSLIVRRESLPDCLEVTAWTEEGEIMGVRHREHPVHGVQFHPESILTQEGRRMLRNFLQG
jgi:anthranilate synthase component 2